MSEKTGSRRDETFSYDQCPLKNREEIRILTLLEHGGWPNDSIECTLGTHVLSTALDSDQNPYEALSYNWGTGKIDRWIKISVGNSKPYIFGVRSNLFAALKQLRLRDAARPLWIDAICIDQDSSEEKNAQVPKMPQIYNGAQNVCVWLGDEQADQGSGLAFNYMRRTLNLEDFDRLIGDSRTPHEWTALESVMTKPWFSRRWVIQEIALAKRATIHCGTHQIAWSDFAEAVALFQEVKPETQIISKSNSIMQPNNLISLNEFLYDIPRLAATQLVNSTLDIFRKSEDGLIMERNFPLDVLISDFSAFKVSRPHDVIYAVLALAKGVYSQPKRSENLDSPIALSSPVTSDPVATRFVEKLTERVFYVDYEKDFVEVCKEFLSYTIKTGKSLDMICRPWVPEEATFTKPEEATSTKPEKATSTKPSWLLTTLHTAFRIQPDGKYVRKNADTLVGRPNQGERNYNASSTTQVLGFRFGESKQRLSLFVDGFIIDVVDKIEACANNGKIPKEWLATGRWHDQSANPPERFWRTLVASRGPGGSNCPRFYPRACKFLKSQLYRGDISTMELLQKAPSSIVIRFLRRVQEVIWMRRLFTTRRNFLGLAPQESKKGDLICILYGCSVPVILRRHGANPFNTYYEFIGECYVHDLMDGEALAIKRNQHRAADGNHEDPMRRTFEIR
ncbi:hypothetical protein JMJ35_001846 [Cladonia borealis]|uniref:Heterokaryon incompatibility domain-containing protein n=1 Tax=Cladonia borealis TaxID=184061 RepID=A0AA39R6H4_9LECA|nr:hypothetical protein JMJ35_001846 [Cladonia borealis]